MGEIALRNPQDNAVITTTSSSSSSRVVSAKL